MLQIETSGAPATMLAGHQLSCGALAGSQVAGQGRRRPGKVACQVAGQAEGREGGASPGGRGSRRSSLPATASSSRRAAPVTAVSSSPRGLSSFPLPRAGSRWVEQLDQLRPVALAGGGGSMAGLGAEAGLDVLYPAAPIGGGGGVAGLSAEGGNERGSARRRGLA